ncbi:MAG: efflux RND transporter permease subunit [Lachnospiraceae bacterium]|nr:efflux RND transporter permease subunit [Lachnospiraceae bacterium]
MDFLTRISLKRPISTLLALLALVVFGVSSILTFELELQPEMEMPMLAVTCSYKGADPETVDKILATPIEDYGMKMQGMSNVQTTSSEGRCTVIFTFEYGTDMDRALNECKADMDELPLPDGCERPKVIKFKNTDATIMRILADAAKDEDVLNYVNNTVKPRLEKQTTVAEAQVSGGKSEYIRILLDEGLMDQYSVTPDIVQQALSAADYSVPADKVRQGSMDVRLSVASSIDSIAELEAIPMKTAAGVVITLRDIADVSYEIKRSNSIGRFNGTEDVQITVSKKQGVSTVTACRQVLNEINRLEAENSDIRLEVTTNYADDIITSLKDVGMTLLIGILLSMLTLYLFFGDIKASLIVGSSMPISLLATLILMSFAKLQLDVMSMGGLVIAIGMMVDSSIVVLESCFRSQEKGLDFRESALEGTREVTASIVASTITTVVVYAPIAVIEGLIGQLFKGLCITIIFAMLTSLIVSLTFIPLFFTYFKPTEKKNAPAVRIMEAVSKRYARAVRAIIPRRVVVVLVVIGLVGASILMGLSLNRELDEDVDRGEFSVEVRSRAGTTQDIMDKNAVKYEEALLADPDIKDVYYRVDDNVAGITAVIDKASGKSTNEKVDEYNRLWAKESGVDMSITAGYGNSTGGRNGTTITLTGDDYGELKKRVYEVMPELAKIDGVYDVKSQLSEGAPEAMIDIDPKKAMDAGLSPKNIASMISGINGGIEALKIKTKGNEYDVRIEYPEGRYDDLQKIMNLKLTGSDNREVTLGEIAELKYEEAQDAIRKLGGNYSLDITLTSSEEDKFRVKDEADAIVEKLDRGGNVSVGVSIQDQMMKDEFRRIAVAIASAVFLVFLVMAMQFESPRFSLMVMMSIPFSLIGSIGLLFITRSSLTANALLGVLMLVGIVVNDGILFVDTTNEFKKSNRIEEALARSGEIRLRPILMTTLTTVLSMVPLVLSTDSGASIMDGMGLIIIGGLMASTMLILFLLPTFYMLFMGRRAKRENYAMFPLETEVRKKKKHSKKSKDKKIDTDKTEEGKEDNE